MIFLAKKFVLSMIVCIFAAREPAKPLNDAQMCGSFLFLWVYGNKNSVYKNIFHTPRISAATQNMRYGNNLPTKIRTYITKRFGVKVFGKGW